VGPQIDFLEQQINNIEDLRTRLGKAADGLRMSLGILRGDGTNGTSQPPVPTPQPQQETKRRVGRPPGSKNKTTSRKPGRPAKAVRNGRRPRNERKLRDVVVEVMTEAHGQKLELVDIAKKVKAKGYKSNAKDFANIVYQTIQELVSQENLLTKERGEDGRKMLFSLKKAA
jgi:spore germination protein YaaH